MCVHNGRSNTIAAAEFAEFRKITTFEEKKTQYFMNILYIPGVHYLLCFSEDFKIYSRLWVHQRVSVMTFSGLTSRSQSMYAGVKFPPLAEFRKIITFYGKAPNV